MGSAVRVSLCLRVTLLSLVVLLVSGCASDWRTHSRSPRERSLEAGWHALEAGRVGDARGVFVVHTQPNSRHPHERGQANLGLGKCALAEGDVDGAINYLERASHLLAGSGWGATCELAMAEAHLGRARRSTTDAHLAHVSHERARIHLEAAYPSLDGRSRQWAAGLLSVFYEAEGYDREADEWRRQAGPYVNSEELASVRSEVLPRYEPRKPREIRRRKTASSKERAALSKVPQPPRMFKRSQWRARKLITSRAVPMGRVTRITIHHTGEPDHVVIDSDKQAAHYLRKMQNFAQTNSGWADMGYHYLVDNRGVVYEGRPVRYQGAHAGNGNLNRGNLGIALIGNFDQAKPTAAQQRALRQLVLGLRSQHQVALSHIQSHSTVREAGGLSHSDCPGRHVHRLIPAMFATEGERRRRR